MDMGRRVVWSLRKRGAAEKKCGNTVAALYRDIKKVTHNKLIQNINDFMPVFLKVFGGFNFNTYFCHFLLLIKLIRTGGGKL